MTINSRKRAVSSVLGAFVLMLCVFLSLAHAQKSSAEGVAVDASSAETNPRTPSPGLDLLRASEADARSLEGGMRPWALLQIARGYERLDKIKAIELLEEALTATRTLPDERPEGAVEAMSSAMGRRLTTRARLQEQVLRELAALSPERAEGLLEQVDAAGRETVLTSLLSYYEKKNEIQKAQEVIYRITAEKEMPYGAALRVMEQMKDTSGGEVLQLFAASLASYRTHAPHTAFLDDDSNEFPNMVARFWARLPRPLVRDAIEEVLKQATPADGGSISAARFSLTSENGAATFGSLFEYKLFQVLPALEHVDPSAAEEYLRQYRNVAAIRRKYPDGERSFSSGQKNEAANGLSESLGGVGNPVLKTLEFPKAQEILAKAGAGHYGEAIRDTAGISDPALQAGCYEAIARMAFRKDRESSKKALDKLLSVVEALPPGERVRHYSAAAKDYRALAEDFAARATVEEGLADAGELYRKDAREDDPNRALKAFWPATNAYCSLLRAAVTISPEWALSLLKQIRDPEIKTAVETALAGELLGVPPGQSFVMSITKSGARATTGIQ